MKIVDAKAALLSKYASLKKARKDIAEGMRLALEALYPPYSGVRWTNTMGSVSSGTVDKVLDHEHLVVLRDTDRKIVRVPVTSIL
jgi:hypothetical protein